jgi:hypothetical protein
MKTTFAFLIAIFVVVSSQANDNKFTTAMKEHINRIYQATTTDEYQDVINGLERIGDAEKNRWEPFYYASFGYIMMSAIEHDNAKKDTYLDQALAAIDKAEKITAEESEIYALKGFIHMMRVTVDPASRGAQYSGMAFQSFDTATKLNPENPRALMLTAQMQYGTAKFFGSSTEEACLTAAKAIEKFDGFTSDNPLAPEWGRKMAEGMVAECK